MAPQAPRTNSFSIERFFGLTDAEAELVAAAFMGAPASAEPTATFKRCTAKADDVYKICRDMKQRYGNDDNCGAGLDRHYARCQRDHDEAINSRFKTDGLDANGRFQPITIPQRQRYIFNRG
jgi:hypothetical protein